MVLIRSDTIVWELIVFIRSDSSNSSYSRKRVVAMVLIKSDTIVWELIVLIRSASSNSSYSRKRVVAMVLVKSDTEELIVLIR